VYWREASVGHSKPAYFLGKTVSNFPRILVGALHFIGWYLILAETILKPQQLYVQEREKRKALAHASMLVWGGRGWSGGLLRI